MAVAAVALLTAVPASAAPREPAPVLQTQAFVDDPGASPANADADDPAIWVHPRDPERSVVLGTLKEGGLAAFDLGARTLQLVPAGPGGRFNNVDVVGDLAVVSDRGRDRVRVYRIDPAGSAAGSSVLHDVTDPAAAPVFSAFESEVDRQRTAYGLAAGRDPRTGVRWVAVTRRHETRVALLKLVDRPGGTVGTEPIATVDLPARFRLPDGTTWSPCEEPGEGPQLEGSVLDGRVLYTAQEDVGIWRIPLTPSGFGRPELIDRVRSFGVPQRWDAATEECVPDGPDPGYGGRWLTADAEGLALANGTLFASSQGDSRFVVYGKHVRDLRIVAGRGTDSVEHSDGSAISTVSLGRRFPHGLLVVHDGERRPAAGDLPTTGFAFVRLEDVLGR
ncbi:hydrolase [Amycolatopsis mediterranei S699]|uniref:Secreted hydrolase n=2 Tax=Amycolatopsis mediterranei TaxID=33910 RepID=A0A0H3D0D8_AMYMU|nr:phytase [Amycolatopsis mediterranei]ADJ44078.1 secreted hydrolase [Amycolatopsis mediterranei U32]AEK40813.1 hydrolase [Amycolatopsis mediterranei S699]AFO75791.1 hydrolase [Amycolatopsis mediterranei S699]AGT82920.1 hydrolase [Amycolatopsis mediterranei RB]KDO06490.1 hydrolase [Amycolatopsis mediterranei]